ncbi:MAG: flagellar protein FliT [Proteobacteria bacterium]|nr:flagellar protein FliT [Pseudomonadota bacterium]
MSAVPAAIADGRRADFARLLELTTGLKRSLENGEWGRAAELELERRQVVERVFDEAPAAEELPALTATLREVVRINDELIGLAEHRRRTLARELDLLTVGREASRAYGHASLAAGGRRP